MRQTEAETAAQRRCSQQVQGWKGPVPTRAGSVLSALCFSSRQPPGTRGGEQATLSRLPGSVISEEARVKVKGPPTLLLSLPEPQMSGTCWLPDAGKQFMFFSVHRQNSSGSGEHWPNLKMRRVRQGAPGQRPGQGSLIPERACTPRGCCQSLPARPFLGSARHRAHQSSGPGRQAGARGLRAALPGPCPQALRGRTAGAAGRA